MKIILLAITIILFALPLQAQNDIFKNDINHTNPSQFNPFTNGQVTDPNITASGIGRGSGLTASAYANSYQVSSWNTPAMDNTAYLEFTITPNAGYDIDFTTLEFKTSYTGSPSITPFVIRSSVSNYTANIPFSQASVFVPTTVNLSGAAFQNVAGPITIRVYPFGSSTGSDTFSIIEFTFKGTVSQTLGIDDIDAPALKFYPNPVQDVLSITYPSAIDTIVVYNAAGALVLEKEVNATDALLDMSSLQSGLYLVRITSGTMMKTIKILKK